MPHAVLRITNMTGVIVREFYLGFPPILTGKVLAMLRGVGLHAHIAAGTNRVTFDEAFDQGIDINVLLDWIERNGWELSFMSESAVSQYSAASTYIFKKAGQHLVPLTKKEIKNGRNPASGVRPGLGGTPLAHLWRPAGEGLPVPPRQQPDPRGGGGAAVSSPVQVSTNSNSSSPDRGGGAAMPMSSLMQARVLASGSTSP